MQYLDDLDDIIGMMGLIFEKARRVTLTLLSYLAVSMVAIAGISIALLHQPMAMATSILLFVTLLYRSVTSSHAGVTPKN